jgi:glycosyltransferase involved in cell wall biosynthesis
VTRAHGLEQVTSDDLRRRARAGELTLSRKYPLYHGGYRLWEVRRSLVGADAQIFLNEQDRDYAVQRLGVNATTAAVLPNGVADRLLDQPRVQPRVASSELMLAFIGSWIPRKGTRAITEVASALQSRGIAFSLRLLGTGVPCAEVLASFAPEVRGSIAVTPRYDPCELPTLLEGAEVLLHPSWTEGFSLALVEGMACGLAPVATRAGGATTVICDGLTGVLLSDESGSSLTEGVARLAVDRAALGRIRLAAQASMQALRWELIAERTIGLYRQALERRSRS